MAAPEPPQASSHAGRSEPGEEPASSGSGAPGPILQLPRYGRYVVLLAIVIVVAITINTIATKPNGGAGLAPGAQLPPFAAPLALGNLSGDTNIATRADEGAAGNVPACSVRGPRVLNICQLYEHGPVVLALFVDSGSCTAVLSDMQALAREFPHVSFAAVAIKGGTSGVREQIRSRRLTFPVGLDRDGALAALYKVASCPQLTFAERGGAAQGRPILDRPSRAELRARVKQLVAESASGAAG
jgi:hypothetical protein